MLKVKGYFNDTGAYISSTMVSLSRSSISDAFIASISWRGNCELTLNVTEFNFGGFGQQIKVISFSAALPQFNSDCISMKVSLSLVLFEITASQNITSFATLSYGIFVGFGIEGGWDFDANQKIVELVFLAGLIAGQVGRLSIDVIKIIG